MTIGELIDKLVEFDRKREVKLLVESQDLDIEEIFMDEGELFLSEYPKRYYAKFKE